MPSELDLVPSNDELTVTREMMCKLTDAELRERGDAMAEAELAAEKLKVERRRLNAAIRDQTDTRARLAAAIDAREESRDVSCEWRPDYKAKLWRLVRLDTGAKLEDTRPMTSVDMQTRLAIDDDANGGGGPKPRARRKKAATRH